MSSKENLNKEGSKSSRKPQLVKQPTIERLENGHEMNEATLVSENSVSNQADQENEQVDKDTDKKTIL